MAKASTSRAADSSEQSADVVVLSSTKGLTIASSVRAKLLDEKLTVRSWDHTDSFRPGEIILQALKNLLLRSRAALIVMTPDETGTHDGQTVVRPRDNLLFEFGLSVGLLGEERTFVLIPEDEPELELQLPSNVGGFIFIRYKPAELELSLAAAARKIAAALGDRTRRMSPATMYQALEDLAAKINSSPAFGGFPSPDLVIGVNPGGAIIAGNLYFIGGRFFDKPQFLAFSPGIDCPDQMRQAIEAMLPNRPSRAPRILVVDASIKRGSSMQEMLDLIRAAAGEEAEIRIAVLIDRPELRASGVEIKPDHVAAPAYESFPYGLA